MAIMSVLMLGIGSAMMLAARAVPAEDSVFRHTANAATAVQQMVAELHTASAVIARGPRMIEFHVHDRDGDTIPESIRYQWSGTPGAVLSRSYKGATPVIFAEDVHNFSLAYGTQAIEATYIPAPTESEETLLASNDATADLSDLDIQSDRWIGQYFRPVLPANTVSWKVTRAKIFAGAYAGTDGVCSVQFRTADASNLPTSTILDSRTMLETGLTTRGWQEFSFNNVAGLSPTQGVCLVVQFGSGSGTAAQVRYRSKNVSLANAARLQYGGSWSSYGSQGMLFYAWGTVTTESAPQVVQAYKLADVRITLQVGSDPASTISTAVEILNRPDVSGL